MDAEGLQLHKPEPLLDPDAPIALRLRLGSGPSVHMVARVLEPGGGGHGPRLAFETSDPLQIYAALAMGAAGSGGQGPLEALEEELQVALLRSESQLRAAAQPSRLRTAMVMATLLLVVGAAAIGALMVS